MVYSTKALLDCLEGHATASAALEAWCAARFGAEGGPLSAAVIEDRALGNEPSPLAGTPIRYRRVALLWAEREVSSAENWYLPERLPQGVALRLLNSEVPFGTLLAPFAPQRRIEAARPLDGPDYALEVRAVLSLPGRGDVAMVRECYARALIDGMRA